MAIESEGRVVSSLPQPMQETQEPKSAFAGTAFPHWGLLLLIWVGAILLRWTLTQGVRVVWGDEPFYLWLGRNWIKGEGFGFMGHADVHHGPLFPMLAGVLYLLTADMALSSEIIYIVVGAASVFPMYGMGYELYDRRVGLIAAAVTAVFPALSASVLHWGTMTEPLYLFLVISGLWAGLLTMRPLWSPKRGSARAPWWSPGLTGLSFGLAYLTRPEAINYFLVIGLYIAVLAIVRGALRRWRFWLGVVSYLLAFALAFVPYAYYVRLNTGTWMVSEKVGIAYLTGIGLAHGDTAAFDRSTWGLDSTGLETFFFSSESYDVSMLRLILDDPKTFAIVLYMNVQSLVRVLIDWTLFPYALVPLAFLGL
ncbi:MAG: glycosyltransferase family 39 protein, partial [Anaerolineae bacterium]|nr:glycosyltransferase family 39 protein [Anaerolineae bacterium]